jgi:hypothetical protein
VSDAGLKSLPKDDPDAACAGGVDTAVPDIYFDQGAKKFWWRSAHDEWVGRDIAMAKNFLRKHGNFLGGAKKEEKLSELDRELLRISDEDYVNYAGPLAGWREGFYPEKGNRILVTRSPALVEPVPGEFPLVERLLECVLAGSEISEEETAPVIDQRPFFYSWWRAGLQCLRECYPERGLCMVLAGDAGCGKTLLKELVRLSFGGREVYPYSYMIGRDNFNAEMLEAELWTVDDETADTSMRARVEFGAEIKKAVANSAMRFRGMLREAVTLTTFKRLFICVNREPDRLMVLPPMDDDIKGKVALLMAYNSTMFDGAANHNPAEKKAFWKQLNDELPHFLHWLLYEWEEPQFDLQVRFGSPAYHHPEIGQELFTLSPEQVLMEQIDRTLADYFKLNSTWCGSAAALRNLLVAEDSPLSSSEVKKIPAPNWVGKRLTKLAAHAPQRLEKKKVNGLIEWRITEDKGVGRE